MSDAETESVPLRDLRAGDVLVILVGDGGTWRPSLEPWQVNEVHDGSLLLAHPDKVRFCVFPIAPGKFHTAQILRRASLSRSIDFPHTCTRCGRPAYVGLNETDHADEGAARTCPAPRGRRAS